MRVEDAAHQAVLVLPQKHPNPVGKKKPNTCVWKMVGTNRYLCVHKDTPILFKKKEKKITTYVHLWVRRTRRYLCFSKDTPILLKK